MDNIYAAHEGLVTLKKKTPGTFALSVRKKPKRQVCQGSTAHVPPGATLADAAGWNPSGIPSATVFDRDASVSSSFPSPPRLAGSPLLPATFALSAGTPPGWNLTLLIRKSSLFLYFRKGMYDEAAKGSCNKKADSPRLLRALACIGLCTQSRDERAPWLIVAIFVERCVNGIRL